MPAENLEGEGHVGPIRNWEAIDIHALSKEAVPVFCCVVGVEAVLSDLSTL